MEAAPADEEVLISGWFIHQPRFAFVCAHKTWFNQLWWLSFHSCGHRNCLTNGSWRFSFTKKMSVTTSTATASVCIFLKKKKMRMKKPWADKRSIHKWAESSNKGLQGETSENTKNTKYGVQYKQQKHVGTKSKLIQGSPDMSPDFLFKVGSGSLKNALRLCFFLFFRGGLCRLTGEIIKFPSKW